jgi:hypothetical protein
MAVITLIDADNWIGIYANDKLIYENHSIRADELLKLLNYQDINYFGRFEASLDWVDNRSNLPAHLSNVQISYMGKDWDFYEYIAEASENATITRG